MKVKYIAMMLISSFIGIVFNPELLAASDSVAVSDLDQSNVVETVVPEVEAVAPVAVQTVVRTAAPVVSVTTLETPKTEMAVVKTGATGQTKTSMQIDQIEFAWGTQNLVLINSTSVDAGVNVMKSGRLIWAHNNTAFNNIKNLQIGDTFAMTIGGVTQSYRVVANPVDGTKGVEAKVVNVGQGKLYHEKLGDFYTSALEKGWTHDLVLMTCAGQNNSSRYLVVADAI